MLIAVIRLDDDASFTSVAGIVGLHHSPLNPPNIIDGTKIARSHSLRLLCSTAPLAKARRRERRVSLDAADITTAGTDAPETLGFGDDAAYQQRTRHQCEGGSGLSHVSQKTICWPHQNRGKLLGRTRSTGRAGWVLKRVPGHEVDC